MFCGPHNNYCGAGAAPAYTSDAGLPTMGLDNQMGTMGIDATGCNGQVIRSGTKTEYVDCPTTRTIQEPYVVPRTITGSRLETRTRTRTEMRTRVVPITKFRNETKYVPVTRQVPYKDYRTDTYTVPKTENYTVRIPTTSVKYEKRTRTRMIPGTKKCPVRVPVYSATCDKSNSTAAMGLPLGNSYDTGATLMNDMPLGTYDNAMPLDGTALGTTNMLDNTNMNMDNTNMNGLPLDTSMGQWSQPMDLNQQNNNMNQYSPRMNADGEVRYVA